MSIFTCRRSQGQVYNSLFSGQGRGQRHLKLIMIIWVSFGFLWVPLGSFGFFGFLWVPQGPLGFLRAPYGSLGFLNFPQGSLGFNQVSEDFLGFLRVFKVPQFSKGFFRVSQNSLKFRRVRQGFQCSLEFPFGLLRVPGIVGLNSIQSCLISKILITYSFTAMMLQRTLRQLSK